VLFFADDFLGVLQLGLTCLGSIAAPLTAILLIDSIRRRGRYDGVALSDTTPASLFWYRGGFRISGIAALLTGSIVALLSLNGASYQGPISRWLGGVDMSILFGGVVSAVVFVVLSRLLDASPVSAPDSFITSQRTPS
jgi:purine-cytosine permease-like protein